MYLSELAVQIKQGMEPSIEIHSFEPSLYLIFVRHGQSLAPLRDSQGQTLRYFSRTAALKPLSDAGLKRAEFVHKSAYGEMIGQPPGDQELTELRQTINLNNVTVL